MSAIDLSGMSDKELRLTLDAIVREQAIRRKLDASPEKIENAIAEYQKATGKGTGEQWEQPVTALQAYRQGAEVEHEGKLWISTHANNTQPPGVSGWRLKPELDEDGNEIPPPYVVPSGAHDSYQQGERVTFDGEVYAAARDGVVHNPTEYPADWAHIVPAIPIEPAPEPESEPEPPDDEEPVEPEPEPEPEPDGTIDNPLTWSGDAVDYQTDQYVTHDGVLYRVQQAHESAAHWPPDEVASLYERQS